MKKNNRLLKNSDFRNIIRSGNKINSYNFSIYYFQNNLKSYRIGITISKKVSKLAVERNLLKRRIKAVINELKLKNINVDVVIIAKPNANQIQYPIIKKEIQNSLLKIWEGKKNEQK